MKILYAIQGTGNGHIARAMELIPKLQNHGDLDILVSGTQADLKLPVEIKYKVKGAGFVFGKKGGVDMYKTISQLNVVNFIKEVTSIPVEKYDLVLNDFEPVVAWACKLKNVHCVGISHQSAVLHPDAPRPDKFNLIGHLVLKYYAPTNETYGFHFKSLSEKILYPVIRKEIRQAEPNNEDFYTVYLPSYGDEKIIQILKLFPDENWKVFSKHTKTEKQVGNISIVPVQKEAFEQSLIHCKGVLCNAGFETPAEALHLKKKLCVIPMTNQYEQQYNAAMLQSMGVSVIKSLKKESLGTLLNWIQNDDVIEVNYTYQVQNLIDDILSNHYYRNLKTNPLNWESVWA